MAGSALRRISVSSPAMVQQEAPSHEYSEIFCARSTLALSVTRPAWLAHTT